MRPGDGGGGGEAPAGVEDGRAPRMGGVEDGRPSRMGGVEDGRDGRAPRIVPSAMESIDGGGRAPAARTSTMDSDLYMSYSGLEGYAKLLESVDIVGTQFSVNQCGDDIVHSQMDSNVDWANLYVEPAQLVTDREGDEQEEGIFNAETDSDHYDDFLVRCEGDTDVEECFPTQVTTKEIAVEEERPRLEGRSKNAKEKAELSRAAKRRAIEGAFEENYMAFSDEASDDCRELTDSSDDDGAVDEERVTITKRKSRSKKLAKRKYYDEANVNAHEQLEVKLCFVDVHQYRRALTNYHIVNQRDFEYLRNDHDRITVCCKIGGTCPFAIMSSTIKGETIHIIRGIVLPHTCLKTNDSSRINSVWVSKTYEDQIRSEPNMKITALIDMVKREFGVTISKPMAYRAKTKALEAIDGHHGSQYLRLRDYLQTVLNTNPGSRCIVNTIVNADPQKNPRFHGLFYCLNAQVQGFLEGCRPYIGVDGCFLKVGSGFQILAATARDGNNNMFPLAFGVVGKEETSTWCWFLTQLRYALGGGTSKHGPFTIMSDRQKGLLNAITQVFPECEQRFCLRHIYANFQLAGFRGDDIKKLVDAAAYAYNHSAHINAMDRLKILNLDAWTWLSKIPTKHWARHAMDTTCKTDLVVNNLSEIFNSYILEQRDKPIVTMMEQIRTKLMVKFGVAREGVVVARWEITPQYVERLETEKRFSRFSTPFNAGNGIWQVETTYSGTRDVCVVNLCNKTCSCRKWDLTGVPCKHAIAVIFQTKQFPEDFISDFFKKEMYALAYKEMIYPVPSQDDWVKTDTVDIEPPVFHIKRGRKKKKRRPSAGEGADGTFKVATITCGNCGLKGHRYTTCTKPLKPHLAIRKAGHKSNRKLPEYMCAPTDPASPPAETPPPEAPRQAPFAPPRPAEPTAPSRQAAAAPRQPAAAAPRQPAAAAPRQPGAAPSRRPAAAEPRRPAAAAPRQATTAPRQAPVPPRTKLNSVRGGRQRVHYTNSRLYSYLIASNGQQDQHGDQQDDQMEQEN